ncbi:hypothetical protein B0T22DRAFT_412436 [Podospora appendiculata]|uniref:Uncharacterized protein n=1 Tax=Podospora appendiculata TaxID=314037 RepID=A0AAE0X3E3_9PEZI|nr:hypothetical protein B0T22DRAFT_412436 [Podospora appendiculata]
MAYQPNQPGNSRAASAWASRPPPAAPPAREPKPSEQIPPLTNLAPSIFVPFREDITAKQSEIPRDRIERLRRILESIDFQTKGVKENLLFLFEREKTRIILEAQEREQEWFPTGVKAGVHPDEADRIIAYMEAPAQPGTDYNIRNMAELDRNRMIPSDLSVRDRAVEELMTLAEGAVQQLEGYEANMREIKKLYLERLDRELTMINEVGMRPEERNRDVPAAPM